MQHATCGMQECNMQRTACKAPPFKMHTRSLPKATAYMPVARAPPVARWVRVAPYSGAMHAGSAVHMQAASCMLHQPSCSAASPSSAMERRVRSPSRFIDIWNTSLQSHASCNEKPCSTQPAVGNMQHEHAKCNIQRTACNTNVQTATNNTRHAACSVQWGPQGRDAR